MAETLKIGTPSGDLNFLTYVELVSWLENEKEAWSWLLRLPQTQHSIGNSYLSIIDVMLEEVKDFRRSGFSLRDASNILSPLTNGQFIPSQSTEAIRIREMSMTRSAEAAAFSLGVKTRAVSVNQATTLEDFAGVLFTLVPEYAELASQNDQLRAERSKYRVAAIELTEQLKREAQDRMRNNTVLAQRVMRMGRRILKMQRRRASEKVRAWEIDATDRNERLTLDATDAIEQINTTNTSYKELMKLKAPVEYWSSKAKEHTIKEQKDLTKLYWYFPVSIIAIAVVFAIVGHFILTNNYFTTGKAPLGIYVVLTGGLVLVSTIALWVGRLLTKLYLSEHHLRNDANERAVMTTTYLALTSEGAASEAERQIILGALFRATPDGIVKDDGPTDASFQAMLSKLLVR